MAELPVHLPAKSARRGRPISEALGLAQHLLDTDDAACALFGTSVRWGRSWTRFFRVADHETFLLNLRVACLFHDIGKANEGFVAAVSGTARTRQPIRHEHLSAFILCLPEVRAWLAANPLLDVDVITAAVLSHHLKASGTKSLDGGNYWYGAPCRHYLAHHDVHGALASVAKVASLSPPPALPTVRWDPRGAWADAVTLGHDHARFFFDDTRHDCPRRRLSLAVKAALIAADSAASALVREGHSIETWLGEVANGAALTAAQIDDHILLPRTRELGATFTGYKPFQCNVAKQGDRVLLLAGCGMGKTLAAYLWTQQVAERRDIGRIVFLYPTRGTATEGFKDYVGWAPEALASLMHGTADLELDDIRDNPSEATRGKRYADEAHGRLFALKHWPKRYFSATVDQFLSFLTHQYGALCALPALADAAVIIDEVHSFDRSMFLHLRSFLAAFDVPVLCMTATLPPDRRRALTDMGLTIYPSEDVALGEIETRESAPRYNVRGVADAGEAKTLALAQFANQERVLWVVNNVDRCIALAKEIADETGTDVLCYHSRFKLSDRKDRHRDVVNAFKADAAVFAVTTQVCEMSLDLDADVLVSEVAPISSLVQRFGRANRHGKRDRALVLTYRAPGNPLPYRDEELACAEQFLAAVAGPNVSQRDLAVALDMHSPPEAPLSGSAVFLEGGYFAEPASFRDESDHARPAVLDADLDDARRDKRTLPEWIVPVPRRELLDHPARPSWLPRYLGVAPSANYTPERGYQRGDR